VRKAEFIDRMAGEFNAFPVVVAIGLAMLDVAYAAQKFVDALPSRGPGESADA
jgi:hypothetical protein